MRQHRSSSSSNATNTSYTPVTLCFAPPIQYSITYVGIYIFHVRMYINSKRTHLLWLCAVQYIYILYTVLSTVRHTNIRKYPLSSRGAMLQTTNRQGELQTTSASSRCCDFGALRRSSLFASLRRIGIMHHHQSKFWRRFSLCTSLRLCAKNAGVFIGCRFCARLNKGGKNPYWSKSNARNGDWTNFTSATNFESISPEMQMLSDRWLWW